MKSKLELSRSNIIIHVLIVITTFVISGFFIAGVNNIFEADFFSTKWYMMAISNILLFLGLITCFVGGVMNVVNQTRGRPNMYDLIAQKLKKPIQ